MNEPLARTVRKFNPGTFQSDGEVIGQFVVRHRELDILLDILRDNLDSESCQHALLVAPRGRGKTMLLARVAAELRANDELSRLLIPVRFMEESLEVLNLGEFWLETLFHLAGEIATRDPELARELECTREHLASRWSEEATEERAFAAVMDAAVRLDARLVLMVENLQSLCGDVDEDFGWKLRGTLQMEPRIILLATATSRFAALDDARQAFFELFRTISLEPLDTGDCRRLWQAISGDEVKEREIRPLQILTGGNPRLLIIVAEFARHQSLHRLMEELVRLIDDHTEYFRGHLEVLPKTERRVYISVIDLWQASTAREIAERSRMDVRTVSTMLGRLVDRGAVIVEGSGRKRRYAAAERLYCIYYKLRREGGEATIVRNLIHFMAVFYSHAELMEMSGELISEAAQWPFIRRGIEDAMTEAPQIGELFPTMPGKAADQTSDTTTTGVEDSVSVKVEVSGLELKAALGEVSVSAVDSISTAKALFNKAVEQGQLGEYVSAIETTDLIVERFGKYEVPKIQGHVAGALVNKAAIQRQLGEYAAVISTCDSIVDRFDEHKTLEIQEYVANALTDKAAAQAVLGEYAAAIATCDLLIERFRESKALKLQLSVFEAKIIKSETQIETSCLEEPLRMCDEHEQRLDALPEEIINFERYYLEWIKAKVRLMQEEHPAAMDAFHSMYFAFMPDKRGMVWQILAHVFELIELGASVHDLVGILSSDPEKSDALTPLVVALRQHIGEEVRAPAEVLEVAADIREKIAYRTDSGKSASFGNWQVSK